MSLSKAIYYGKEHRKPYYDSRRFDWSCKCHGSCSYCRRNRLFRNYSRMLKADATKGDIDFPISGRKIDFRK